VIANRNKQSGGRRLVERPCSIHTTSDHPNTPFLFFRPLIKKSTAIGARPQLSICPRHKSET
jgi:hypothetical protein